MRRVWSLTVVVLMGCAAELGPADGSETARGTVGSAPVTLTMDRVDASGFDARAVVDGEPVLVSYLLDDGAEEIAVQGDETYARWRVDRAAQWVEGEVAGVPLHETDRGVWQGAWAGRTGRVLEALAGAVSEMGVLEDEVAEPTRQQGLLLLGEMLSLAAHRTSEPVESAPEGGVAVGEEGTAVSANTSCQTHTYVCGTVTTVGCWFIGGWGGLVCGLAGVVYCGEMCSPNTWASYWAGNCNYVCQSHYGCRVNYCVGGGCSTCY